MLPVAKIHNFFHSYLPPFGTAKWLSKKTKKNQQKNPTKFLNNVPLQIEVAMCSDP